MTLRKLRSGESFFAAIIQDDRSVAALAYDQSMMLIGRTLDDALQVNSIAVATLTPNSWLLSGYLHPPYDTSWSKYNTVVATEPNGLNSDSDGHLGMLGSNTLDSGPLSLTHGGCSGDDDGSIGDDIGGGSSDSYSSDAEESDDTTGKADEQPFTRERRPQRRIAASYSRDDEMASDENRSREEDSGRKEKRYPATRLAWSILERSNLEGWVEAGKDWKWIVTQFPNRTPGAVRTYWYTKIRDRSASNDIGRL